VLWEGAAELLLWKLRRWIEGAVDPGRILNWPICVGQETLRRGIVFCNLKTEVSAMDEKSTVVFV